MKIAQKFSTDLINSKQLEGYEDLLKIREHEEVPQIVSNQFLIAHSSSYELDRGYAFAGEPGHDVLITGKIDDLGKGIAGTFQRILNRELDGQNPIQERLMKS